MTINPLKTSLCSHLSVNKYLVIAFCCLLPILFASCAHSVYPVESLYQNYNQRMRSDDELAIKARVQIYFNERDIKREYTIISLNTYKPFSLLPFKCILEKKMCKRFLAAAVKKADEEGGNAILVKSAGFFYVLNIKDWNADDVPAKQFINPIYNLKIANQFKKGLAAEMKRSERNKTEKAFMKEIKKNCEYIREMKEIRAIRYKLDILSDYNKSLKRPKKEIEKTIKRATRKLKWAERRIKKEEEKAAGKDKSKTSSSKSK